ncbi:MAG: Crp/Fnr family transcriptional regulator [Pseudomonadota bacterium]
MSKKSDDIAALIADLDKVTLFAGLEEEILGEVASRCQKLTRDSGRAIISAEDETRDVYFLIDGKARALNYSSDGKAVILIDIEAGGFFGEMAAIDGEARSSSVEALSACTLLMLPEREFLMLLHEVPEIAHSFLRHYVREVRTMSKRLFEFRTMAVQNRIQAELLRLARVDAPADGTDPVTLTPAPTLAEIADRVSTHREAVSREISRLTKLGLLKRGKGALIVTNPEALSTMVRNAAEN